VDDYHNETVTHSNYKPYNFSILSSGSYSWMIKASKLNPIDIDWAVSLQGFDTDVIRDYWAWWNSNWTYWRSVTNISGEYPTFNITYDSKFNSDFSDIRFNSSASYPELNFTIRSKSDNQWVFVTVDTNNITVNETVYLHFGNVNASFGNSTDDTFQKPVAYFTFDDGNKIGTTVGQTDITGSGYDASTVGGSFQGGNGTVGVIGQSYNFSRTIGDFIKVTNLPIDNNDYSVVYHGQTRDVSPEHQFMYWRGANSGTGSASFMEWRDGDAWYSGQYNNDLRWAGSGAYFLSNTWQHYGNIRDGSNNNSLYINNSYIASVIHGGLNLGNNDFFIGEGAGTRVTYGVIDEMILYDRDISTDLLNEIYSMSETNAVFGNISQKIDTPIVTLIEPVNNFISDIQDVFLNCSSTGNNLSNLTMYIDTVQVATISNSTPGTSFLNLTFNNSFSFSEHNWYCVSYNTNLISGVSENRAFRIYDANAWWNGNWTYNKEIDVEIHEVVGNYSLPINVTYDSGMNLSFKDLRFIYNDTELSYWIEEQVNGSWAYVWVFFPSLTNLTFNMYFGNPLATSTQNANETFILYDDFTDNINGWGVTGGTISHVNNSFLHLVFGGGCSGAVTYPTTTLNLYGRGFVKSRLKAGSTGGSNEDYHLKHISDYSTRGFGSGYGMVAVQSTYNLNVYVDSVLEYAGGSVNRPPLITTFSDYIIKGYKGDYASSIKDGVELDNATNITNGDNLDEELRPSINSDQSGCDDSDMYIDWIFVSNYTYPEPTFTIGNTTEDTQIVITLIEPLDNAKITNQTVFFNCSCTSDDGCEQLNMTIDGQQVNTTTNSSANQILDLIYINASIPDGNYDWYCTGTGNNATVNSSI